MLLSLTPPAPFPTILFTLTFPAPLPESLPLPLAWDSHLQIVNNLRIASPPDVHALDRSAAWVSLIDTVNFDLSTLTLTCTFIDHSKEEWPLTSSCVDLLETVISDVNRSAKEAESEAEDHSTSGSPPSSYTQGPAGHCDSPSSSSVSTTSTPDLNTNNGGVVVNVKTPKPKKRRSFLAALVASLVPLPSSRATTPASSRPPSPSGHLPTSPTGASLRSPIVVSPSPSQLQNEVSTVTQEIITPPPGMPISRYLRRRARSTLVDAFRRFVLPELGFRYRSEEMKVNPHVSLPHGGPFYALWATRSMMRSVATEMERVLMGGNSNNEERDTTTTSSASSSPLETPIGPGDLLDDCTTTDESSVHSVVDQTGYLNANPSSPLPIPTAKMRRKINPMLSTEDYDFYSNLRETYARLRTISSQLEVHVQAENRIECVGAGSTSDSSRTSSTGGPFEDVFNSDCESSSNSSSAEQFTSAEIKSRRRAWSSRLYLVRGCEIYGGGNSSRCVSNKDGLLSAHKRSHSEPATPTLRGGSPMSLLGLGMPVRPSPLSQTWIYEPEQSSSLDDGEYGNIYVGFRQYKSGAADLKKLGRSCEDPPFGPGQQRRKRCVSMIAPSLRTSSSPSDRSTRKTKLRPKVRKIPPPRSVEGYEDHYDYTGVGSGSRLHVREDVYDDEDDEMDTGSDEVDDMETWDVDVDVCEVGREAETRNIVIGMEKLHIADDKPYSDSTRSYSFPKQDVDEAPTTFPSPSSRDDAMDDYFDSRAYIPSRISAHSPRYPSTYSPPRPTNRSSNALRHFRYGSGSSDFLRDEELDNDGDDDELYENDPGEFGYGYSSRSRRTDRNKGDSSDDVGCGLYKKPSLEEFILPHPRSRVDSGLDVAA